MYIPWQPDIIQNKNAPSSPEILVDINLFVPANLQVPSTMHLKYLKTILDAQVQLTIYNFA